MVMQFDFDAELTSSEFIRRFLQHVLPCGFYKIRYFGFLALCNIRLKLAGCFDLIGEARYLPALEGLNALEVWQTITGKDSFICPRCSKGRMVSYHLTYKFILDPG
jgi:hypothetical protein